MHNETTTPEITPSRSGTQRLRILAVCGIIAPFIAFGTSLPLADVVVRAGLLIAAVLAGAFSIGLIYAGDTRSYRLGGVFVLVAAIGYFSEGVFPGANVVNDAVFALAIVIAALLVGASLLDIGHWKVGALSLALGVITLALAFRPLYIGSFAQTGRNIAIALWLLLVAVRMFVLASGRRRNIRTAA